MKATMNLEEHEAMKQKRFKNMKEKEKNRFDEADDMSILIKKKEKNNSRNKSSHFRNNYKNYQYDYEEDFYEPRY